MVDTDARAIPGDNTFDLPAALYTKGTIDDTPMPTNKNPAVAVYKYGIKTAINKPVIIINPLVVIDITGNKAFGTGNFENIQFLAGTISAHTIAY